MGIDNTGTTALGRRRPAVSRASLIAAVCCVPLMMAQPAVAQSTDGRAPTARVIGVVVDPDSRRGVENVAIHLGPITTLTDDRGRFLLVGLQPGVQVLRSALLGYVERSDTIYIPRDESLEVEIQLTRDPVQLKPIEVTVRSRILERNGFFARRASGYAGHFFTRDDVIERDPRTLTELLRPLPGVRLMRSGIEGDMVVFERAINLRGGGLCQPALFLDGVRSQIRMYDAILDPSHVEGIEVYTGAASPGRYNDPCGVVLVWTRVP